MPKDYALPPDISRMNFLNLLEHLKDDANDHFTSLACSYTLRESTVDKSKAMFYAGQMDEAWVGNVRVISQPGDFYGGWVTPNLEGRIKGAPGTQHW